MTQDVGIQRMWRESSVLVRLWAIAVFQGNGQTAKTVPLLIQPDCPPPSSVKELQGRSTAMTQTSDRKTTVPPSPSTGQVSSPGVQLHPGHPRPEALHQAQGVYMVVHGHFYQPPRENPYLGTIEQQPSAAPFRNWNERIHHESYRANAFARVMNDRGEVVDIVNNYEFISFNMGPTLLSWLERYDLETYQRIIEADRLSCQRLNGHGNAIAQAYNHIILPLANAQDKRTQIRWGKDDFKSRFGRDPEGMWLAETAIDHPTVAALIAEGIRFVILAPSQAARCRPIAPSAAHSPAGAAAHSGGDPSPWLDVTDASIDPTRPYRCYLPGGDRDRDYLDLFFYDGPISAEMGFSEILSSSQTFTTRMGEAIQHDDRPSQLISVATDGETFGHHRAGAEKALTYALIREFPTWGWTVTNYAHYLSLCPPTWEVELKPVTAWSCFHGVDRWQTDCGCGGGGGWQQQWRQPLRDGLNWLRDQLMQVFETVGSQLFRDPWAARNDYIAVLRSRHKSSVIEHFLHDHQTHPLTPGERVDALRLMEMQRYAMYMFTSCGWFFDEISRPEGTQILRYAARAIELAGLVSGVQLEAELIRYLEAAPSNVPEYRDGADVYQKLVKPSQVSVDQVVAHYAISSLFKSYDRAQQIYCYGTQQLDYQRQRMGALTLAIGHLRLRAEATGEVIERVFAVLHLGSWDFHCCVQPFESRLAYAQLKDRLRQALDQSSAAHCILAMNELFGAQFYDLQNLYGEERHHIMRLLSQATLMRLDQLYTQVYRDNYSLLGAFYRENLEVPRELQVAADIALSHRANHAIQALEHETSDSTVNPLQHGSNSLVELEAIAREAHQCRARLTLTHGKTLLEQLLLRSLWHILHNPRFTSIDLDIAWLQRLLTLGQQLQITLSLSHVQELYFDHLKSRVVGGVEPKRGLQDPVRLMTLATILSVDASPWLALQRSDADG